jgi:glycosyltransferase involved in cell wall biosynthesis
VNALHCHHYSPFVYGVLAACVTRRLRVVFTEHGRLSDDGPSPKRRAVNPILGRFPGTICAVSDDLKRHMVAEGFPERRVEVIHNGIETGPRPTAAQRDQARRSLGLSAQTLDVGAIGRLDPVKNLPALLTAHATVLRRHRDARLVVVGDGSERPILERLACELGIGSSVIFTGYRGDARRLLPAFDLYANCSIHEGLSLTILEAMAASLPVVATRVGGNPEAVIDGETGLLVPARSAPQLAAAILSLAGDAGRRHAMGEAARWRVKRYFAIERMVDRYRRGYAASGGEAAGRAASKVPDWRDVTCVESAASSRLQPR